MKWLLFPVLLCFSFQVHAQQRIDSDFAFQNDPAKKYSIYVPSTYDASTPNKLMLGLHPLNPDRWNAISWCDTLIDFAETNQLLLLCPDGGIDGAIDDQIDTAFTTVLLDSMLTWYNVDESKIWAMGFSWGGRTTYSYGLRHPDRFAGFLPIGAAVTGTDQVNGFLDNGDGLPFYVVHGSNDIPGTRFTPIVNALKENNACVETNLLSGVGHTIDFPNRNQILTDAFEWLEEVNCSVSSVPEEFPALESLLFPNPVKQGDVVYLDNWSDAQLFSSDGKMMIKNIQEELSTATLTPGVYILMGKNAGQKVSQRIVVE